jgi:hypothetical protein
MRKDNAPKPKEASKTMKQRMEKARAGKLAARHDRLLAEAEKQHTRMMERGQDEND